MSPDYKVNIGAAQKDKPGAGYDVNIGADQKDEAAEALIVQDPNTLQFINAMMLGANW